MTASDVLSFPYDLSVPSQGISRRFHVASQLEEFFQQERAFFTELQQHVPRTIHWAGVGRNLPNFFSLAFDAFGKLSNSGGQAVLENYVAKAQDLRILIGQGRLGRLVQGLIQEGDGKQAYWMVYILCAEWTASSEFDAELFAALRAASAANPAHEGWKDLFSTAQAVDASSEALRVAQTTQKELAEFLQQKRSLVDELEQLYRTKLTIEEPANTWGSIKRWKTLAWIVWLLVFAGLVVLPISVGIEYWSLISDAVVKLTANATGTVSFAGLAVISIPALLYAWLLKNVSRGFIQNLNLADDANHRRSLALTYLGLIQDTKHPPSEQERAIILNALFRPIPPQTIDEGPPAGLIDLVKGK